MIGLPAQTNTHQTLVEQAPVQFDVRVWQSLALNTEGVKLAAGGYDYHPDVTAPVITLLGSNPMTVRLNATYVDPGAEATDDREGSLTSKIVTQGVVNTHLLGTYVVTYTVKDAWDNTATSTRTVEVVFGSDPTPPVTPPPTPPTTPTPPVVTTPTNPGTPTPPTNTSNPTTPTTPTQPVAPTQYFQDPATYNTDTAQPVGSGRSVAPPAVPDTTIAPPAPKLAKKLYRGVAVQSVSIAYSLDGGRRSVSHWLDTQTAWARSLLAPDAAGNKPNIAVVVAATALIVALVAASFVVGHAWVFYPTVAGATWAVIFYSMKLYRLRELASIKALEETSKKIGTFT